MRRARFNAWIVCLVAAMSMALNGYDAASFNSTYGFASFISHFAGKSKTISPNLLGAINTAYVCGSIVPGYLITPSVSKRFGRRITMQIGCVFVIVASFVQTFAPNMTAIIIGRLIVGIGHGFALPTGPVYVAEIAPSSIRGKILTFWQVWFTIGAFLVYWIAYGMTKANYLGIWQWRTVTLLQTVLPSFVFVGLCFCPETPRWLVERGKLDAARRSIIRVREAHEVDEELEAIIAAINYEKVVINKGRSWLTPYKVIWTDHSVRRRFFIALFINGGQQVNGNAQLASYSTLIYQKVFIDANTIFLINALAATFNIFFTLNCAWLVDRLGRKKMLFVGAIGEGIALLTVASIGVGVHPDVQGQRPYGEGIAVAFCFFLFALFYKPTWGATVWVYTSEIFSTNVRAHAVAMASQFQNVTQAVVNQFFPLFLAKCGFYTFFFFAGINVILASVVLLIMPETKGVPLEEMDTLFGGPSHRGEGRAVPEEAIVAADGITKAEEIEVEDQGEEVKV